jgi:hypothetical protein
MYNMHVGSFAGKKVYTVHIDQALHRNNPKARDLS